MRKPRRRYTLEHPLIRSQAELNAHDPLSPAYLLIPAALVRPLWLLLAALTLYNPRGRLCRGLELLLVCMAEPDTRGMLSGFALIRRSLVDLLGQVQDDGGIGGGPWMN
jgi:hypothetical protein